MFLIVGLGNPGFRYRKTRHNVGFMLIDRLSDVWKISVRKFQSSSIVGEGTIGGERVVLAKPQTYMNKSGRALESLTRSFPVEIAENLLVVYDDVALPLGTLRFRPGGSGGGQKGMRSIIDALDTREIPRLRIGIGMESMPDDLSTFVLSRFRRKERKRLDEVLSLGVEGVESFVLEGMERTMSSFNSRKLGNETGKG